MTVSRGSPIGAAMAALWLAASFSTAHADGPFAAMAGTWRGGGQVKFTGGQVEKLTCKAYYTTKSAGSTLGISLLCASASNPIRLIANLTSSGGQVTGTWEERTFNSSGNLAGKASDSRLNLSINGTLTGTMSISLGGSNQSVSILTDGTGFKSVNLQLSKGS